jgi:hypothetical protein
MEENKINLGTGNIILLSEVIDVCNEFTYGEMTYEELVEWGKKVEIKQYLPLMDKMSILLDLTIGQSFDDTEISELLILQMENKKFWFVLLKYTNIEIGDDLDLCSFDNYDLCFPIIGDWILGFCIVDYNRLIQMLNDTTNVNNIKNISKMLENIDMEKIKEYSKQVNETFEYLDKNEKLVEELSNIAKLNNPSVNKLMKALEQEAVLDINKNGFKTKKK